jgi:hypothetical protein
VDRLPAREVTCRLGFRFVVTWFCWDTCLDAVAREGCRARPQVSGLDGLWAGLPVISLGQARMVRHAAAGGPVPIGLVIGTVSRRHHFGSRLASKSFAHDRSAVVQLVSSLSLRALAKARTRAPCVEMPHEVLLLLVGHSCWCQPPAFARRQPVIQTHRLR